ncbi:NACHT domain-containing protein [Prosthecobacter sp.]|jgi:hypothetical protein|uniref:NACHT domain-containing protein n=1 Tax=Prosthecobacter sp. TaxID=1965333 RepID=UPI0037CB5918
MAFLEYIAATSATGTLWPIIKEKIKDAGSDFIKEKFKEAVKSLVPVDSRAAQAWQKAAEEALAKSLAKFIERAEVALDDAEADVGSYAAAFNDLIASSAVQKELARAFVGETPSSAPIAEIWMRMELRPLPNNFDWNPVLRQYQKILTASVGQTEILKKALDTLNLARIAKNTEASLPRTPGFNLSGYKKAIIASHGYLKLQQLAVEAQHSTPIGMKKVFVNPNVIEQGALPSDFYCLPIEDQALLRSGKLKEHHVLDGKKIEQFTEMLKNATPQMGLTFATAASQPLIVLTGDPGSGKSTLLQYLSLEWAEIPDPAAFSMAPVPLLIELRRYAEQREKNPAVTDFPSFLQHGTDQTWQLEAPQVESALASGKAWLLLDGFDEVFDQSMRDEIISRITHATIAWNNIRIVVTTRSFGYRPESLQQAGFLHGHIQPFDNEQIANFLERWHSQITDANKADLYI